MNQEHTDQKTADGGESKHTAVGWHWENETSRRLLFDDNGFLGVTSPFELCYSVVQAIIEGAPETAAERDRLKEELEECRGYLKIANDGNKKRDERYDRLKALVREMVVALEKASTFLYIEDKPEGLSEYDLAREFGRLAAKAKEAIND